MSLFSLWAVLVLNCLLLSPSNVCCTSPAHRPTVGACKQAVPQNTTLSGAVIKRHPHRDIPFLLKKRRRRKKKEGSKTSASTRKHVRRPHTCKENVAAVWSGVRAGHSDVQSAVCQQSQTMVQISNSAACSGKVVYVFPSLRLKSLTRRKYAHRRPAKVTSHAWWQIRLSSHRAGDISSTCIIRMLQTVHGKGRTGISSPVVRAALVRVW